MKNSTYFLDKPWFKTLLVRLQKSENFVTISTMVAACFLILLGAMKLLVMSWLGYFLYLTIPLILFFVWVFLITARFEYKHDASKRDKDNQSMEAALTLASMIIFWACACAIGEVKFERWWVIAIHDVVFLAVYLFTLYGAAAASEIVGRKLTIE